MTQSAYNKLNEAWSAQVIPPYQQLTVLNRFASTPIGDIGIETWVKKVAKTVGEAKTSQNKFNPGISKPDFESVSLGIYATSKRLEMDEEQMMAFNRTGVLQVSSNDAAYQVARRTMYNIFRGPKEGDEFTLTQYNWILEAGTSNGTVNRPVIISEATGGAWGTAGNALADIAKLAGNMEAQGYDPRTSIVFYPRVASSIMRKYVPIATGTYSTKNVKELIMEQGFLDVLPVEDACLYTAAGADPTAALFDLVAVDLSQVEIGYTRPETTSVVVDDYNRKVALDFEVRWVPFFIPRLNESDSKIRKGVSRVTAIAQS